MTDFLAPPIMTMDEINGAFKPAETPRQIEVRDALWRGHQASLSPAEYRTWGRTLLQDIAAEHLDAGDHVRAQIALVEVERHERLYGPEPATWLSDPTPALSSALRLPGSAYALILPGWEHVVAGVVDALYPMLSRLDRPRGDPYVLIAVDDPVAAGWIPRSTKDAAAGFAKIHADRRNEDGTHRYNRRVATWIKANMRDVNATVPAIIEFVERTRFAVHGEDELEAPPDEVPMS